MCSPGVSVNVCTLVRLYVVVGIGMNVRVHLGQRAYARMVMHPWCAHQHERVCTGVTVCVCVSGDMYMSG